MFFPILTKRLSLSPLETSDLDSFLRYRQDPEVARYQSWEPSYSEAQAADLIKSQEGVSFPAEDQWLQIGIRLQISRELVGDLGLHSLLDPDQFELGFTVATKHQGNGYATEAARALLDQLFTEHRAKSVVASADSRNLPSKAVLRGLGFLNQPHKSWIEEFKGETVTVEFFELLRPSR